MFRKILVAYDGSAPSRKACQVGLDLSQRYQAQIHVVAVARPPDFAEDVETEAALETAREHFGKQFGALEGQAARAGLKPHLWVVTGDPAEQIVRAADQQAIDLIVLGHRGHGMFER
jgi:nucleotide-binding universal stress UspA family protein